MILIERLWIDQAALRGDPTPGAGAGSVGASSPHSPLSAAVVWWRGVTEGCGVGRSFARSLQTLM